MNVEDQNPFQSPKYTSEMESEDKKKDWASDDSKVVTLAEFTNAVEAHALRGMLADHGIESRVTNEASAGLGILAGTSSSFSPSVMIREADVEAALAIKKEFLVVGKPDSAAIAEWTCGCGETVDAGFEVCWNCEAFYTDRPGAG